jgi:hypothetical protein
MATALAYIAAPQPEWGHSPLAARRAKATALTTSISACLPKPSDHRAVLRSPAASHDQTIFLHLVPLFVWSAPNQSMSCARAGTLLPSEWRCSLLRTDCRLPSFVDDF